LNLLRHILDFMGDKAVAAGSVLLLSGAPFLEPSPDLVQEQVAGFEITPVFHRLGKAVLLHSIIIEFRDYRCRGSGCWCRLYWGCDGLVVVSEE
jgi:hypothetical protein